MPAEAVAAAVPMPAEAVATKTTMLEAVCWWPPLARG